MPPETYTLNYRRPSDEKNRRNRYVHYKDYDDIKDCLIDAEAILKVHDTIQIKKNSK